MALTLAEGNHDRIVLKAHRPTTSLLALLALNDAPRIITVRDPRDSVCSLMAQFGWPFDHALNFLSDSADLLEALPLTGALVLRYEDAQHRAAEWASLIARHLALSPDSADLARIADDFEPASVRGLISSYVEKGLIDASNPGTSFHPATHWHPNHLGDGEIAKFKTILTAEQAAVVFRRTRGFCRQFGYAPPARTPVVNRLTLVPETGFSAYLDEGFSHPEPWGTWTDGTRATLNFPLARPAVIFRLTLEVEASPSFTAAPKPSFTVSVNELRFDGLPSPDAGQTIVLVLSATVEQTSMLIVHIDFDQLRSPASLFDGGDARLLGLGVRSLSLDIGNGEGIVSETKPCEIVFDAT